MKGMLPLVLAALLAAGPAPSASRSAKPEPLHVTAYNCSGAVPVARLSLGVDALALECVDQLTPAPTASEHDETFQQLQRAWRLQCELPPALRHKVLTTIAKRPELASEVLGVKGVVGRPGGERLHLCRCQPVTVALSSDERRCYEDLPVVDAEGRRWFAKAATRILAPDSTETPCFPNLGPAFVLDDGRWVSFQPQPVVLEAERAPVRLDPMLGLRGAFETGPTLSMADLTPEERAFVKEMFSGRPSEPVSNAIQVRERDPTPSTTSTTATTAASCFAKPGSLLHTSAYNCSSLVAVARIALDDVLQCRDTLVPAPPTSAADETFQQLQRNWRRVCRAPRDIRLELVARLIEDPERASLHLDVKGVTGHATRGVLQLYRCKLVTVTLSSSEKRCYNDMPVVDAEGRRWFVKPFSHKLVPDSEEMPCFPTLSPTFQIDDGRWVAFKPQPEVLAPEEEPATLNPMLGFQGALDAAIKSSSRPVTLTPEEVEYMVQGRARAATGASSSLPAIGW